MRRARGFTLVEVLVAMLIAATVVAALARSTRSLLAARHTAERLTVMTWIGQRTLEEWIARPPSDLEDTEVIDLVADPHGPFWRRRTVRPGPAWNLRLLEVAIGPEQESPAVTFRTLRRAPWRPL